MTNDSKVRQRQARLSRVDKAMAKFAHREPEDLTVKEAIALLRMGLEQERRALGLPDTVPAQARDLDANREEELTAVQSAMELISQLRPMARPSNASG